LEYSKYWALLIAKVEHKAKNKFCSTVKFDLVVLNPSSYNWSCKPWPRNQSSTWADHDK